MGATNLECWRCGAPLGDLLLPLARNATCDRCDADLHVCLMCMFHDRGVAHQCREPIAEEVNDKQRANFCGYLQLRGAAHRESGHADPGRARAELDALFGLDTPAGATPESADSSRRELDRLFGLDDADD